MKIKIIGALALTALAFGSCKKGYLDVNEVNPNQTQNPPISGLLAAVTYQTGINFYRAGDFTSYYVQYLASPNKGSASDVYENADRSTLWFNTVTTLTATNPFGGVYNTVADGRIMQQKAVAANGPEYAGVAKVTEALNMSMMIDIFGDMPYTEAFNASIFAPKYDKAEDIFARCLTLLDEAVVEFGKAGASIKLDAASDLIHGGKVSAWIKTAYALKARLLNRLSKLPSYNPAQILSSLALAYTANTDDAQVTRFFSRNPWGQAAANNAGNVLDVWLSEQWVDALNGKTFGVVDPRLKLIATAVASGPNAGQYVGTPNGNGRIGSGTAGQESYLSTTGFYSSSASPLLLVTYAEMKFIEAEATFASDKTRSYNAYLAGIAAHMDKVGVPAAEKNAYLANPAVAVGTAAFAKDLIFKEKYVAMFLQPEAWTDARRFDYKYKDFTLPTGALLPAFIRRSNYPTSELSRNGANVPNIGSLTERLWWDK